MPKVYPVSKPTFSVRDVSELRIETRLQSCPILGSFLLRTVKATSAKLVSANEDKSESTKQSERYFVFNIFR